ncbi:glutamine amidotransferase [Pseudarthrobacter sp. J64]|uniref:glutamine amidotransferase n=1 Tax=Pseudarthrobacter sp. J64 TaxID=3116485 RepID=UPI002E80B388|nr:glutamine amidotransferase [Pseudarthrobacter sp. J64]MEE2569330.1 glutamine amidotransferase [Pseudarthrobacter sp. J64]
MKPFVLLASRPEVQAADEEYAAYLRFCGLEPAQLRRVRLDAEHLPDLDLDSISGVIVGGSPFTSSDPPETKSAVQKRVERELAGLLDTLVAEDFPFLGACYGVGTLGTHQGAVIDRTFGEPLGAVQVRITPDGAADPLLAGLPAEFSAFVGHKEACTRLPEHAALLASSASCPVQMFRIKQNLYATQFHPELDVEGLVTRIRVYRYAGYFAPEAADELISQARTRSVDEPVKILRNFVERYAN